MPAQERARAAYEVPSTAGERTLKNRDFDVAASPVWNLAVYGPVHGGWRFTSIGGRRALDEVAARGRLGPDSRALEIGSGLAQTCCYLATRHGCRVTGLELNDAQVAEARAHLLSVAPDVAARIEIVQADVLSWRPPAAYDAVYAIDVLALLPGLPRVLARARRALRPGGRAVLAEIMAGPRMTPELRRLIWDMDGFVSLPDPNEYSGVMEEAGFRDVAIEDRTGWAVECFATIHEALGRNAEAIASAEGVTMLRDWKAMSSFYLDCFSDRVLLYGVVEGTRPARARRPQASRRAVMSA